MASRTWSYNVLAGSFLICSKCFTTRLDSDSLSAIARAIEEAPLAYRQGISAGNAREQLRAVDALAGWIGARLAPPPTYHDGQLMLPIDNVLG